MKVFVSHSHQDKPVVQRIISGLEADGHIIWVDSRDLLPGDNIHSKIQGAIEDADALIVVVSENSFRSDWVQREFSAMAFQQISKRERRIIPVKIDGSAVPGYLADRLFLDLSEDFEGGLSRLRATLQGATPESLARPAGQPLTIVQARGVHLQKLREALRRGRLTLVCGAGVSIQAGIPAWGDLLIRLLERMMDRISKVRAVELGENAAREFQRRHGASALILGKYLKNNLGRDFLSEMRDALYASQPASSTVIDSIVALSRPQRDGKPLDSIITFNFDCLVEERLSMGNIPNRAIYSEAINHDSNELPIYHVHGYLPRTGAIAPETELVFSEDAYHSQFIDAFSWSNLIQLNKLTQNTCVFVGISLTDPNMRRLLDVAWRKNPGRTPSHYIIKRVPRFSSGDVLDEISQMLEEQDANALGLNVVWIDDFADLPDILNDVARGHGA